MAFHRINIVGFACCLIEVRMLFYDFSDLIVQYAVKGKISVHNFSSNIEKKYHLVNLKISDLVEVKNIKILCCQAKYVGIYSLN